MLFTSPVFLLLFLPVMLGVYTLTPTKFRPQVICLFSIAFYTLAHIGSPASILFLLLCAIFTYCATFAASSVRKPSVMIFISVVLIGVLAVLRYLGVWADEEAARRFLPIGASFYLLASYSCINDVRRGDAPMPRSFIDVLTYITYFPVMIAGPVIKYKDFERIIKPENMHFSAAGVGSGVILFARGFIKRVAIAAIFDEYYSSVVKSLLNYNDEPLGLDVGIMLSVLLLVSVYFAFSGYSDMGRGISAMLGIPLAPDFGSCILCYTPLVYARNFFSSLSDWIDDYIGKPLGEFVSIEKSSGIKKRMLTAGVSVVCSLVLLMWFKIGLSVLPAIAVLLLPAIVNGLFDSDEWIKKHKWYIPISWFGTLLFTTLFWMLIRTRDLGSLALLFGNLKFSAPMQSYMVSQTFFNLEFPLALSLIFLVQLPMLCGVIFKKHQSPFAKLSAVRWTWSLFILIMFVLCIYYYLPQYPALATEPFRDIIF
ncbi:MAG: hypothetical protein J6S71_06975 [Clostridia bacterium]|nr:hypothetical protein [Clostridia bacterium]